MRGRGKSPLKVNAKDVITGFMGGAITIFILGLLTRFTYTPLLIASFGASCVLAFGLWNSPLSQPRNIIGGHFISTLIGLVVYHIIGNEPWSLALGVGLAIGLMMLTKTTHPPAGADPIIVILGGSYTWEYLFTPVLTGSIVIVLVALLINNLRSDRKYPVFWI
ncbi:HPP family protein [Priestia endophytica]|uniref:HPP family protein n=2 Tax=Priestia endophytica TaxID=135735 RepID=A0AAX1Q5J8_9BACI|nr:HPP family protein [Priestia endophytica]RAS83124.1 HPP family protein [Priestia endophytica]RAS86341.1 HPP family protein [Priestia endophytica]